MEMTVSLTDLFLITAGISIIIIMIFLIPLLVQLRQTARRAESGELPGSAAEMFRVLRPCGGVAYLGQPKGRLGFY